ncbi:MAG: chromate resistance protein ChrB domain-containing protein [Ktedonobacteraceae bacterium]
MKWITREHVKVERVACPWLIKKFVDKDALYAYCQGMIRQGGPNGAFKADPAQSNAGSTNPWDRTGQQTRPAQ